jgi:hypothetical protein
LEQFQICPGEAFRMLVRSSRNGNVKLPALAAQLVWSGGLPWPAARHEERLEALLTERLSACLVAQLDLGDIPTRRIEAQL